MMAFWRPFETEFAPFKQSYRDKVRKLKRRYHSPPSKPQNAKDSFRSLSVGKTHDIESKGICIVLKNANGS